MKQKKTGKLSLTWFSLNNVWHTAATSSLSILVRQDVFLKLVSTFYFTKCRHNHVGLTTKACQFLWKIGFRENGSGQIKDFWSTYFTPSSYHYLHFLLKRIFQKLTRPILTPLFQPSYFGYLPPNVGMLFLKLILIIICHVPFNLLFSGMKKKYKKESW